MGDLARRVSACVGNVTGDNEDYLKQLHDRQVLSENRQSGRRRVASKKLRHTGRGLISMELLAKGDVENWRAGRTPGTLSGS